MELLLAEYMKNIKKVDEEIKQLYCIFRINYYVPIPFMVPKIKISVIILSILMQTSLSKRNRNLLEIR